MHPLRPPVGSAAEPTPGGRLPIRSGRAKTSHGRGLRLGNTLREMFPDAELPCGSNELGPERAKNRRRVFKWLGSTCRHLRHKGADMYFRAVVRRDADFWRARNQAHLNRTAILRQETSYASVSQNGVRVRGMSSRAECRRGSGFGSSVRGGQTRADRLRCRRPFCKWTPAIKARCSSP